MKFFDVLESVLQAALLRFRSYRTKQKDDRNSIVPASSPEFSVHEHLERLQAQVHYLGHEVETMRQVGVEVVKKIESQTVLIEELAGMLEGVQQSLAELRVPSNKPASTTAHHTDPQQKPKKQILN